MPRRDDDETTRGFFDALHKALDRMGEFARELGEHKVECKGNQLRIEGKLDNLHRDHATMRRAGMIMFAIAIAGILIGPGFLVQWLLSRYGITITFGG